MADVPWMLAYMFGNPNITFEIFRDHLYDLWVRLHWRKYVGKIDVVRLTYDILRMGGSLEESIICNRAISVDDAIRITGISKQSSRLFMSPNYTWEMIREANPGQAGWEIISLKKPLTVEIIKEFSTLLSPVLTRLSPLTWYSRPWAYLIGTLVSCHAINASVLMKSLQQRHHCHGIGQLCRTVVT